MRRDYQRASNPRGPALRRVVAIATVVVALGVCAYAGGKPKRQGKTGVARVEAVTLKSIKSTAKTGKRAASGASANVGQTIKLQGKGFGEDVLVEFISFAGSAFNIRPTDVKANKFVTAVVPDTAVTGNVRLIDPAGASAPVKLQVVPTVATFTPAEAVLGNQLLIDGAGFSHDSKVIFPGVSAPVTPRIVSPSRIDILVPATARTGKVVVVTEGGRSAPKKLVVQSGRASPVRSQKK